jgi:hypothetical protein
MELHKIVERLEKEGATPEEILKAIKQRRYMLQKVKEYQKRTYKKITVSVRKSEIEKLKKKFPDTDEKILTKILCTSKLIDTIFEKISKKTFDQIWSEVRGYKQKTKSINKST